MVAAERGLSIAAVAREALEAFLGRPDQTARARAIAAVGGFQSGIGDVSERHDKYLGDDFA